MKNIPDTLIERVVEKAFDAADVPDKDIGEFFSSMQRYNRDEMRQMLRFRFTKN